MAVTVSADALGWLAATLMVATFGCRDARCMRPLAVATNLAFIGYGFTAALAPVLALHALLLPINLWRWWECSRDRGHTCAPGAAVSAGPDAAGSSPLPGSGPAGTEPWPPVRRPTFTEEPR